MGDRPGEDLSSISADKLPSTPDRWDLETLRRGLDDAGGTEQDILPLINNEGDGSNEPGDSEGDFYTGGGALGSNRDDLSDGEGSLGNNESSIRDAFNCLDVPFLDSSDLADISSATQSVPVAQALTQPPTRTLRSRPTSQRSSSLVPPLIPLLSRPLELRHSGDAVTPLGLSSHPTIDVNDDRASVHELLSPLSSLQEEWLDGQSLFISDAESEGIDTAEDEASSSSANEQGLNTRRPKRAYSNKGQSGYDTTRTLWHMRTRRRCQNSSCCVITPIVARARARSASKRRRVVS